MTTGGSLGSIWCGAHQDDADDLCWPWGQGYGNHWSQSLAKTFVYGGSGTVTITLDYFTDCETHFDYVDVYVIDDKGERSNSLRTYTGSILEGTNHGTPTDPASDEIVVASHWLPDSPGAPFQVELEFTSDLFMSDQDFFDTTYGAFGVDNIRVTGTDLDDLSDFEPLLAAGDEYDGWVPVAAPEQLYMQVQHLDDLEPMADPECRLEECVLIAAVTDGSDSPHPLDQHEELTSNIIPVPDLPPEFDQVLIDYDVWMDLPLYTGVGWTIAMHYYPWTCPETGEIGWTKRAAGSGGYMFNSGSSGACYSEVTDHSNRLPAPGEIDSLKLVFELVSDCHFFSVPPEQCNGPEQSNHSPYFDHVRVGFASSVVGIDEEGTTSAPAAVTLRAPAPNPFDATSTIEFSLASPREVALDVFNTAGRRVRRLLAGGYPAGEHRAVWDGTTDAGRPVAAGIYFVRLSSRGATHTKQLVYLN